MDKEKLLKPSWDLKKKKKVHTQNLGIRMVSHFLSALIEARRQWDMPQNPEFYTKLT